MDGREREKLRAFLCAGVISAWVAGTAGCAADSLSKPPPSEARLASLLTFVSRAERENVPRDFESQRLAQSARDQHEAVLLALAEHDSDRAWRALAAAEADAELAYALARRTQALAAADRATKLVASARAGDPVALGPRELERPKVKGKAGDPNWPPPPHLDPWDRSRAVVPPVARPTSTTPTPTRAAAAEPTGGTQ